MQKTLLSSTTATTEKQPRRLLPRNPHDGRQIPSQTEVSRQKSRDGCATCKKRRRKCDEMKPACSQCLQRQVACGGYSKKLTWKNERLQDYEGLNLATTSARTRRTQKKSESNPCTSQRSSSPKVFKSPVTNSQVSNTDIGELPHVSFSPAEEAADFDMLFLDLDSMVEDCTNQVPPPLQRGTMEIGFPIAFASPGNPPAEDLGTMNDLLDLFDQQEAQIQNVDDDLASRLPLIASNDVSWAPPFDLASMSPYNIGGQSSFSIYRQSGAGEDNPENIAFVFKHRTCEVLCIKEALSGNPWRKIVWPLAEEHPALYHALAAMTCFNGLPGLRAEGTRHLTKGIEELSLQAEASVPLEVTLTTALALAIAQTWYHPRSSNGITYLGKARSLLQQAVFGDQESRPLEGNPRLTFLANTWMYLDVLTRITSCGDRSVNDDLVTDLSLVIHGTNFESQFDPLMGCAHTLFPLIGRVADIVNRVRRAPRKSNTPAIVSKAVELMVAIDRWAPLVIPDEATKNDSVTSDVSDLVQTANAYKWSALLLLYQAVPELPCRLSEEEMAQKVLILIATVPLSSKAIIFPVLPLMIAGCEATEVEDRDWVRSRWQSLYTGNGSGIVDRCLELTSEVWRRRDGSMDDAGSRQPLRTAMLDALVQAPGSTSPGIPTSADTQTNPGFRDDGNGSQSKEQQDSARISTSGSTVKGEAWARTKYVGSTVKSKMHWLSVMEEWGWEVMLG
ncbi:fungal-specific transcription factor domain-containing protein [Dactylonectria estremocensis]|uniref:Fungal-specific transcription factor domain-containing protein n=1 Tax=Dactylonectria estremocensis TaxID=1079267 RepID=A0A9P9IXF1_9HYPO|nr:fungal-specific transcription factor domain-containing protein [Dactylonectria estremocensis]